MMVPTSVVGPVEGRAWRPGRSGNAVSWDGASVVKRHASGIPATLRELAVLGRVADLPVPRVRAGTEPSALHLEFVNGMPAGEAIEAGRASDVLFAMGRALRQVQDVDPRRFASTTAHGVVSHGDFAPYNVLVDDECDVLTIVDWEATDIRDPLTDLAWCQWQFERLFPRQTYALGKLFEGYGESPSPARLAAALEARVGSLSAGQGSIWTLGDDRRHHVAFDDRREAAAFVAALSRVVNAPLRVGPLAAPSEVWSRATESGVDLYLNATAMETAVAVFQAIGGERTSLHPEARLVVFAGHTGPLGLDQAIAIL
jgi:aminoglycoside phosphotransferase (APT) family kinase protein